MQLDAITSFLGHRLLGVALLGLTFWLLRFDMARQTLRVRGLPRFTTVCLLAGYVWLAVAGVLTLYYPPLEQGLPYDATLHSIFVGFVLSMVFGHAPIIFPAVLGLPIPFRKRFYAHLLLLHTSLLLRIGSDALGAGVGRQWGRLLNTATLLVFFVSTILFAVQGEQD